MSIEARLTCARRACIARALELSEHPDRLSGRDAVAAASNEVRAAIAAARRIDPTGFSNALLRAELRRRQRALAARFDLLVTDERRAVVAQVVALAAIGRAAGHPVRPQPRDLQRAAAPEPGDGAGSAA